MLTLSNLRSGSPQARQRTDVDKMHTKNSRALSPIRLEQSRLSETFPRLLILRRILLKPPSLAMAKRLCDSKIDVHQRQRRRGCHRSKLGEGEGGRLTGGIHHDGAVLPRDGDEVEASNDSSPCSSGGFTLHSDSGYSSALEDDCASQSASLASDPRDSGDTLDQASDLARALAEMGFGSCEPLRYEESRRDPLIGASIWLDDPPRCVQVALAVGAFHDRITGVRIYGWGCMDGHWGVITQMEVWERNPRLRPVVVRARLVAREGKLCVLGKLRPGNPMQEIEIESTSTHDAHLEVLFKIGKPLSRDPGGVVLSSCLRQVPPPCQASMLGGDCSRGHRRHLASLLGHRGRPLRGLL